MAKQIFVRIHPADGRAEPSKTFRLRFPGSAVAPVSAGGR